MQEITQFQLDPARLLLIDSEKKLEGRWGCYPDERPFEQQLRTSIIVLDKPSGISSHLLTRNIKTLFAQTPIPIYRIGHGGTLDPNASGILPLTLDHATLVQEIILRAHKTYIGTIHVHEQYPESRLREVSAMFVGKIYQYPPDRSAIKRQLRIREIFALEIIQILEKDIILRVECEAGTYMRKLAVDIGEILGSGAHLTALRRTQSGCFSESTNMLNFEQLQNLVEQWSQTNDPSPLQRVLHPMEIVFHDYLKIFVRDEAITYIQRGMPVRANDIVAITPGIEKGDTVAVFTLHHEILARGVTHYKAADIIKKNSGYIVHPSKIYRPMDQIEKSS